MLTTTTLKERPLAQKEIEKLHEVGWPAFMRQDKIGNDHWGRIMREYASYQILLLEDDQVIAMGNAIPIFWDGSVEGLPAGWDDSILRSFQQFDEGINHNTLSALAVVIHPKAQGRGLSQQVIQRMKKLALEQGFRDVVAPVRPTGKSEYPKTSIDEYITWMNEDGFMYDRWLRVHQRVGGEVVSIARRSMYIEGTIAEWENWTGEDHLLLGANIIPGGLVPLNVKIEHGTAHYIEPNVWVHHKVVE
ncbi:GNAT family N-acetyltransferase [Pontibacillus yanchengensis]|nr:GNAT family N-acetyltransferase [Pontibacillus yanchengensis]